MSDWGFHFGEQVAWDEKWHIVQFVGMMNYVMVAVYCRKAEWGPEISSCLLDHSLKLQGSFVTYGACMGFTGVTEGCVQLGTRKDGGIWTAVGRVVCLGYGSSPFQILRVSIAPVVFLL